MTDEKLIATRVLAVVREVYEEGRSVVGERWSLFKKMKEMADRNDAVGMMAPWNFAERDASAGIHPRRRR